MDVNNGYKRHNYENRIDLAGEHRWGDAGQLFLLVLFFIGMISDLFILKIFSSWQVLFPWYFRVLIFIPLFLISGYFAQNGVKKVFKEKRKELEIIRTGVFGIVRHPIYLGSILVFLSFVILSFSVVALVIFFVIVIFYFYLCKYEENLLLQKLGKKYCNYMKDVPMLIPRIWRKSN